MPLLFFGTPEGWTRKGGSNPAVSFADSSLCTREPLPLVIFCPVIWNLQRQHIYF